MAFALALPATSCAFLGSGDSEGQADTHVFTAADEVGEDPFSPDVAAAVPEEVAGVLGDLVAAADEAEQALDLGDSETGTTAGNLAAIRQVRLDAATTVAEQNGLSVIAPPSVAGVGLYGGSGINACDIEGLIGFLNSNPAQAAAWAGVHGIDVTAIESYVRSLTAGFLIDDVNVANHTFADGAAQTIPTTLAAGTAVLVDFEGVPRVRCKCGNPLDSSGPQPIELTMTAETLRGRFGREFTFVCPPNPNGESLSRVWGVDAYTDDSYICASAVHAGVIDVATGGPVTLRMEPGLDSYEASERNGIVSKSWPAWSGTFVFVVS
ncbi:MAG: DUF6777 domain-containing protein [Acidimicrobiales bacterium]